MGDRGSTVAIAVAGIAATAVVGLAATVGAWFNSRDDRREQSALARQSLNYERRVAVYLDAIDFVETQERALYQYGIFAENRYRKAPEDLPRHFPLPQFFRRDIPFEESPPQRLTSRLRALGSNVATDQFQQVETLITAIPANLTVDARGRTWLRSSAAADRSLGKPLRLFDSTYKSFYDEITDFEATVHSELGVG